MICPCCKRPVESLEAESVIRGLRLGPVRTRLALVLLAQRGTWLTAGRLVDMVYGDRNDGGPNCADEVIDVTFHHLKKILKPFGITLEGRYGPGGGRRMAL